MKPNEHISAQPAYTVPSLPALQSKDIVFIDEMNEIPEMGFPARFDTGLFALVTRGEVRLSINLKEYTVKPNNLLLIAPNSIILKPESSNDFSALCMVVSTELLNSISASTPGQLSVFLYIQDHPVTALSQPEADSLKEYYWFIRKQVGNEQKSRLQPITYHLFSALFYEILNIIDLYRPESYPPQNRQQELFGRFLMLLKEHFKENRSVAFYAGKLCITPKYLSAISKELTQRTAGEWIDHCVVLEAKKLLKSSTKPVQEISDELHFPNQSFFGKYFKHHTGCSPKQFRNS